MVTALHPPENVAKMRAGQPLDDGDRAPWLAAIAARIDAWREPARTGRRHLLGAEAALSRARSSATAVRLVYLEGIAGVDRRAARRPARSFHAGQAARQPVRRARSRPGRMNAPLSSSINRQTVEEIVEVIATALSPSGATPRPNHEGHTMSRQRSIDELCVNTIRTLCIDAVQQANSGHPGTPMAMAPVVYTLWQDFLRFDPEDPIWPNRDRFVLSSGHASTLLYSILHLTGVKSVDEKYERLGTPTVSLDDLKHFRQLDSKCPGHPEYHWTSGVETTTGPLGQGIATSVGMAIARQLARAPFQPARTSSSSTTTSTRCAATAA